MDLHMIFKLLEKHKIDIRMSWYLNSLWRIKFVKIQNHLLLLASVSTSWEGLHKIWRFLKKIGRYSKKEEKKCHNNHISLRTNRDTLNHSKKKTGRELFELFHPCILCRIVSPLQCETSYVIKITHTKIPTLGPYVVLIFL